MTPSQFLEFQTLYMQNAGLGYSYLRNAEGYPDTITGDVDILVEQISLAKLRSYYRQFDDDAVRVVQMIRKPHDLYVMLYFPQSEGRKFLVIEFFSGLIYRNRVIFPASWLIENSTSTGIWRRLPDRLSITYTYLHYLIYKGYLPEKYVPLLDRHGLHPEMIQRVSEVLMKRSNIRRLADPRSQPEMLRQQLRGLVSKWDVIRGYIAQALAMRRNALGACVFVHPHDVQPLLEFAEKYHLFRPTHRYGLYNYSLADRLKVALIVMIGGLAVVADPSIRRQDNVSEHIERVVERR